jgi:hypothetical protein
MRDLARQAACAIAFALVAVSACPAAARGSGGEYIERLPAMMAGKTIADFIALCGEPERRWEHQGRRYIAYAFLYMPTLKRECEGPLILPSNASGVIFEFDGRGVLKGYYPDTGSP